MGEQSGIEEFLEKIRCDLLSDPQKSKRENSDVSWWLMKLASDVNKISQTISENQMADVESLTINIASYALIIAHLQNKKIIKKKKTRKAKKKPKI